MASPMFGWSAQDVFTLVQICNRFCAAYRNDGDANIQLKNFKEQVLHCQQILNSIQEELQQHERDFFYSKFQRDSLKSTLEQCVKLFDNSEFLKPTKEQKKLNKAGETVKWLWSGEEKVKTLSRILEGHMNYIQVFLQLLQSKNSQKTIAHLEAHTKLLHRQDQHHQRLSQDIRELRDLLLAQGQPRRPNSRTQSVTDIHDSTSNSAVIDPEIYIQTQKQLVNVQGLLDEVSSELNDPRRDEDEKAVLRDIQKELEAVEERIFKSIERNEVKGVQNALAQSILREHREIQQNRRSFASGVSRPDSGYPSSISSAARFSISSNASNAQEPPCSPIGSPISPTFQLSYLQGESSGSATISRKPVARDTRQSSVSSGTSYFSQVVQASTQQYAGSTPDLYRSAPICQAEIVFGDGKRKPVTLPCTVWAKQKDDWLCEIYPEYEGKVYVAPALIFDPNCSRPIPHIFPRVQNEKEVGHLVKIEAPFKIIPAMTSLEYMFKNPQDSRIFQEAVFNKDLVLKEPITIRKIRSNSKRDKESDLVSLRVWRRRTTNPTREDCSIMYHVNDPERPAREKIHREIFLHDVESLSNEKGSRLRVNFKGRTSPGKKLGWLKFEFAEKTKEERKNDGSFVDDRATLAKILNPNWTPTAGG